MAVLLLIRHALTEMTGKRLYGQRRGIPLSDRGREQAASLAERLSSLPIAAVFTSPLERCVETAGAVAGRHGLEAEAMDGLLEVDYGRWTGRSFAQLRRMRGWQTMHAAPSTVRFPEGETLGEVQARAVRTLTALAERGGSRMAAVVTHGDVVRLALAHFAGVHLDLYQRMEVAPASVSVVALADGPPRVIRVNDTGSMDDVSPRGRTGPGMKVRG
ncbi:MAG: MSMEG_4193 family putative phosphomutase [Actinomycetota bacterium]|nr:MSMEG_4193 family putative phosphomutase [Actinomycetota bacterium]